MIYLLNNKKKDDVINIPILDIVLLTPKIELSKYNSLIFSSKNAVLALEKMGIAWKEKHIFTIGEATKTLVESYGVKVFYSCKSGYGEEFAIEIIKKYPFGKYLYCRAKEVATNIGEILKRSGISIDSSVVYKTECTNSIEDVIKKDSVIIFTSPKVVRCFFNFFEWDKSFKAVCIGRTTKKSFPKNIKVFLPEKTTIDSALELAKKLEN